MNSALSSSSLFALGKASEVHLRYRTSYFSVRLVTSYFPHLKDALDLSILSVQKVSYTHPASLPKLVKSWLQMLQEDGDPHSPARPQEPLGAALYICELHLAKPSSGSCSGCSLWLPIPHPCSKSPQQPSAKKLRGNTWLRI